MNANTPKPAPFHPLKIGILLCCLAMPMVLPAEVVLVEDQQAVCTVVTGEDDGITLSHTHRRSDTARLRPAEELRRAAEDLAGCLNDIAWLGDPRVEVKVVENIEEVRTPYRILLGTAAIEEYGLEEEAAVLSYPGYVYRTIGNDLLIFGRTSKGTANGVYGFLQNELGVRWFGPHELFTVLPERTERISVADLDRTVEPSFTGSFGMEATLDTPLDDWRRQMRLATFQSAHRRGVEPFASVIHSMHQVAHHNDYFETHPEYFRMAGGRRTPHASTPAHTNLCWSNPEVIELAVEAARNHFQQGPQYHTFPLAVQDSAAFCECEECVALQPDREFRGSRVASDMFFHFVNETARKIKEEFPDRWLGVLAYRDVTAPPLDEIEDNVFAMLVLDVSEHYDPNYHELEMQLVEEWEAKGIPLAMYYYLGLAKLAPAYFPLHLSEVLKDLHAKGFRGLRSEAYPGWPWTGPMIYLDAQLRWDVTLDPEEVLGEYFSMLYGPAAPYVSELYGLFEEIHMRPRGGGFLHEHYNFQQFRPYTREDLDQMQALIASANAAIEELGDTRGWRNLEARRLGWTTNGLRLFLDMLEGLVLARELEALEGPPDDFQVMEWLPVIDQLNRIRGRHEQVYREAILQDPYHGSRFHRDTATPVRSAWKKYLSDTVGSTLARFHAARQNLHRSTRTALQQRVEEQTRDMDDRALFMVEAGAVQLGENMAGNPGFEEINAEGRPERWGSRPVELMGRDARIDTVEHSPPDKRFGQRSGRMEGISTSGWYLNSVEGIESGEFYLIEIDARLDLFEMTGPSVFLRVQWRGEEAGWFRGRHTYENNLATFNDWERLRVVARAPEGADRAQVFLVAENLFDGDLAFFDNLSVRQVTGLEEEVP